MAYLARILNVEGFGIFGLAMALNNFGFLALSAGLDNIAIREISKNKENIEELTSNYFYVRISLSVLCYLLVSIYIYFSGYSIETKALLYILTLNIIATGSLINWIFIALEKVNIVSLRIILIAIFNLLGILLLVETDSDILIATIIIAGFQILFSALLLLYFIKNYFFIKLILSKEIYLPYLKNTLILGISGILIALNQNLTIYAIDFFFDKNYVLYATGIMFTGTRFMNLSIFPIPILQSVFFPSFSKAINSELKSNIFNYYMKFNLSLGLLISIIVYFYPDFLTISLWGTKYIQSIEIVKISAFTIILSYINAQFVFVLVAWGEEKKIVYITLLSVVSQIIFLYFLVPIFQIFGLMLSYILSDCVIFLVLIYFIMKYKLKIDIWESILKVLLISASSTIVIPIFSSLGINELISLISFLILYLLIALKLKLFDLSFIKSMFSKS
jgi:O-antigen/teichoic acid export membrane protein